MARSRIDQRLWQVELYRRQVGRIKIPIALSSTRYFLCVSFSYGYKKYKTNAFRSECFTLRLAEEASNILLGKGAGQVLGSLIQEHVAEVIGNMHNPGPLLVNKPFALLDWPYGSVSRKAEQALHKLGREPGRMISPTSDYPLTPPFISPPTR
jgi:hypothetical protein